MEHRFWIVCATVCMTLLSACDIPPPQPDTPAEMQALRTSARCTPDLPVFGRFRYPGDVLPGAYIPPNGLIVMNNDAGWCQIRHSYYFNQVESIGALGLARAPAHGEVRLGAVGKEMRIAYRPAPGFTGQDQFVVHMQTPQPWDIPIRVQVEK